LREPFAVEFSPAGEMLIAEMTGGNRVLRVDGKGVLHVLAGTGAKGFAGDGGPATAATFNGIHNFVVLANGNLLIADSFNHAIRKIEAKSGIATTIAGDGKKGFRGDGGPAAAAQFDTPIRSLSILRASNSSLPDIGNKRVRPHRSRDFDHHDRSPAMGRGEFPPMVALALETSLVDPRAVAGRPADGSFYVLERSGHALRHVDAGGTSAPSPARESRA
jgi:hypothetical protein